MIKNSSCLTAAHIFVAAFVVLCMLVACGQGKSASVARQGTTTARIGLKGDRSVYGLACEGCTDSVVVLLPEDGSDPVEYDIIAATRRHKVLGVLKTGDRICVVPNVKDSMVADMVVDLDQLCGIWCYTVMPKLRDAGMTTGRQRALKARALPDSVKEMLTVPREYGFYLKRHGVAQSVGYVRETSVETDDSPVVYPQLGYFTEWHTLNGNIVMTNGTPHFSDDGKTTLTNLKRDTCTIDYLDNDSLVLTDREGSRSYYRKTDLDDVNRTARSGTGKRNVSR